MFFSFLQFWRYSKTSSTLPFHNWVKPTMLSECDGFDYYNEHSDSKYFISYISYFAHFTFQLQWPTILNQWNMFHCKTISASIVGIKGYLHYKMKTSQVIFRSRDIHSMIYEICDVMMNISIWSSVQFWIYLLNHNSLTHQTWSIDRYK